MSAVTSHQWVDLWGHDPKVVQCSVCGATGTKRWRPFDPYRIGPRYHPPEPDEGVDPDCDVHAVRLVLST